MPVSPQTSNLLEKKKRTAIAAFLLVLLLAVLPFFFSGCASSSANLQTAAATSNEVSRLNANGSVHSFAELSQMEEVQTQVSLDVLPNTGSLGDAVSFVVAVSPSPPTANDHFTNLTLLVYRPDGTVDLLGPFQTDSNGSQTVSYEPKMIGNYTAYAAYAGQLFVSQNATYLGAVSPTVAFSVSSGEVSAGGMLQDWRLGPEGGRISESDGILIMSGGDGCHIPPCLFRDFTPSGDFEISFDLKAETLGEVILDQAGEGFTLCFGHLDKASQEFRSAGFWCRARSGGQFLLAWHDDLCDKYGWQGNWEPFVYDGLQYNNGYQFWHPDPPVDRSTAPVKPDVWYVVVLKVTEAPFTVTGEVYDEHQALLGSLTVNSINDFTFREINQLYMSTGAGGTFYIRNFTVKDVQP